MILRYLKSTKEKYIYPSGSKIKLSICMLITLAMKKQGNLLMIKYFLIWKKSNFMKI